jgi:5-formyltetrahydrofolate cyclo-ligase
VGGALPLMNTIQLRKKIRTQRRLLSKKTQRKHQLSALQHLKNSGLLKRYNRFAVYLHSDGELHTDIIIRYLLKIKKQVFLPVLYPLSNNRLWFYPYTLNTRLANNRFNIQEPVIDNKRIFLWSLDIVFMPLVAFDNDGHRIGMGGGFYDRTFSYQNSQTKKQLPMFIGLAHQLQQYTNIKHQPWDISLDAVITDKKYEKFTKAFNL